MHACLHVCKLPITYATCQLSHLPLDAICATITHDLLGLQAQMSSTTAPPADWAAGGHDVTGAAARGKLESSCLSGAWCWPWSSSNGRSSSIGSSFATCCTG
mmetsp:Transcript_19949/g.43419  ORF Transcript_19949/g.43419 Transcript_19949/m.43419 type:complete len:102 (+) Transcript_19949:100-405(+)